MTHSEQFSESVTNTVKMIESHLDLSEVDNMDFDNIEHNDYPDYCDAYCSSADYKGVPMTEEQLEILNTEYSDFVYEELLKFLF